MDIDSLIAEVYKRAPIWDKRNRLHANRPYIDRCWKDIAIELQTEEFVIRKKWKYLRDKFAIESGKEMKCRSEDAADKCPASKWVYFKPLLFLKQMVTPRVSSGSLQSLALNLSASSSTGANQPELEPDLQISDQDCLEQESSSLQDEPTQNEVSDFQAGEGIEDNAPQEDINLGVYVEGALAPPLAYKRQRKSNDYQKKMLELEEKKIQYLMNKPKRSPEEDDMDLMFYKSLLGHIKMIPPEEKIQFQTEIQAVVQKYAYPSAPVVGSVGLPYYQSYRGPSYNCNYDGRSSPSPSTFYEQGTARNSTAANVYHTQ